MWLIDRLIPFSQRHSLFIRFLETDIIIVHPQFSIIPLFTIYGLYSTVPLCCGALVYLLRCHLCLQSTGITYKLIYGIQPMCILSPADGNYCGTDRQTHRRKDPDRRRKFWTGRTDPWGGSWSSACRRGMALSVHWRHHSRHAADPPLRTGHTPPACPCH